MSDPDASAATRLTIPTCPTHPDALILLGSSALVAVVLFFIADGPLMKAFYSSCSEQSAAVIVNRVLCSSMYLILVTED